MAKCTKAEKQIRLRTIEELVLKSARFTDIVKYSAEKWKIKEGQVCKYLKEIKENWQRSLQADMKEHASLAIKQREDLVIQAIKKGDLRTALSAMDSRDKIKGLFEDKVNISGEVNLNQKIDLSKLSDGELLQYENIMQKAIVADSVDTGDTDSDSVN